MLLFSGSQSTELTDQVAKQCSIPRGRVEYIRFGDSELKPRLISDVRGQEIVIIASTSNPVNESYMEFFLLVDALRRCACSRIIAILPYFGYARQNQQHSPGEPVSAMLMAKFIEMVGVDEFVSIDLHEEQITGFFSIPVTHLSAFPLLAETVGNHILSQHTSYESRTHKQDVKSTIHVSRTAIHPIIVLSPDQGGVERTRKFRDLLDKQFGLRLTVDSQIGIVEKLRNLDATHQTKAVEISGDVKDKIVVIPDDVIVSGGTMLHAAQQAMKNGAVKVYSSATHADFIENTITDFERSAISCVIVGNTIPVAISRKSSKIRSISVASLLSTFLKTL